MWWWWCECDSVLALLPVVVSGLLATAVIVWTVAGTWTWEAVVEVEVDALLLLDPDRN